MAMAASSAAVLGLTVRSSDGPAPVAPALVVSSLRLLSLVPSPLAALPAPGRGRSPRNKSVSLRLFTPPFTEIRSPGKSSAARCTQEYRSGGTFLLALGSRPLSQHFRACTMK